MSAFDDEFGLFGEEGEAADDERRSTLGARRINTSETIIDEIEPEDESIRPRRRGPSGGNGTFEAKPGGSFVPRRREAVKRDPIPDEVALPRAVELLTFLAKRLVSNPDAIRIETVPDSRGARLELEVDPEDLGKVIGRGGRVAQALRTLVRAGAEGRVTIDIIDVDDEDDDDEEVDDTPATDVETES